jgi:hypothetical protein
MHMPPQKMNRLAVNMTDEDFIFEEPISIMRQNQL